MSRDSDDDYFPSTPSRYPYNRLSPDKSTFGSGSVSSSISSPPIHDHRFNAEGEQGPEDEEATTPTIQQLKKSSGFASVRVGLGSPNLTMKRTWTSSRIGEGRRTSVDRVEGLPEESLSNRNVVDQDSGLPTPPGTESDIGPPPPAMQRDISRSPTKSSPQTSPPRPPRHPRRTSSQHLPSLPDPDSPGPSSQRSSPRLRDEVFQRRQSPAMSRSTSTSSSLALSTVKEPVSRHSPAEGSRTIRREYQRDSPQPSPNRRTTGDGGQREILVSPEPEYRSGSVSPRKAHQRSPSLPSDPGPRRPQNRTNHSQGSSRNDSTIEEEEEEERHIRSPVGISLDERIREAEEKIERTKARRPRTSDSTPPVSGGIRRHDSYGRNSHSPTITTSNSTLRRSATVSSASALTPNGGSDSSGRRHGTMARVADELHEREHSGGSGSSGRRKPIPTEFRNGSLVRYELRSPSLFGTDRKFSPPSKPTSPSVKTTLPSSRSDSRFTPTKSAHTSSPAEKESPSSRFATTSRLQNHTSPIDRFRPPRNVESRQSPRTDGSGGHAGHGGYTTRESREWRESISGLPQAGVSHSRQPVLRQLESQPVRRADSVLGTNHDRYRYERRGGSVESALSNERQRNSYLTGLPSRSRYAIGPGDSVSVAGGVGRDGHPVDKDPLEVLRRMEEKRSQHREQWEAERSASVMGDHSSHGGARPTSRLFGKTPRHARPSTSMSSMRDIYDAPRTAPIESWRARRDQILAADSPLVGRGVSRPNQLPKPATEPRPMRSSTSIGGRSSTSLDFAAPTTEHGRLLFEACRALELKLGPNILAHVPELIKTFHSSTRTAEHVNSSLRDALQLVNDASVKLDLDDISKARHDLVKLEICIRDASRASDQNVREFTRIMLDLPKLLRQADKAGLSRHVPRTASPGQYESPIRASHDMMRPSTSLGEIGSPTYRYSLDSRRPVLQPRLQPIDRSSTVSNLVAKMKGLTPKRSPLPQHSDLQTIEQSPPHQLTERIPSNPPFMSQSQSRSSLALSTSPIKSSRSSIITPRPPPRSPERRNVLRKKASQTSTHTVRGSSAFMPTSSKVQTTTALSVVNASHHDRSYEPDLTPAKSIRSSRTMSTTGSEDYSGSPTSGYSFAIDQDARDRGSMDSAGTRGEDAVSILEHSLAAAAKTRDGEERKPSVSERFRATLKRGSSIRAKD